MNELIYPMIKSLVDAIDSYKTTSAEIENEVNAFKEKLTIFAEEHNDITTFYTEYEKSGLQEEYINLVSKLATQQNFANSNNENHTNIENLPSVKEFLEQYRISYNQVRKRNGQKAKQVYNQLFSIADKTDDLIEAQIIIEKQRLLWEIVRVDAIEIFENKLKDMDPLYKATTAKLLGQIDAYKNSSCEEELNYKLDIQSIKDIYVIADYMSKLTLASCISFLLISYVKSKKEIYSWRNDELAKKAVTSLVNSRNNLRKILAYMENALNYSYVDLFNDESIKIWLLGPVNKDEFGKVKTVLHPSNYKLFKKLISEEILCDISIVDILFRV